MNNVVYIVASRPNADTAWSLINICDPNEFNGSMEKAEQKAVRAAMVWQEIFVDDLVTCGPISRSKVNHCMSKVSLKSFRATHLTDA